MVRLSVRCWFSSRKQENRHSLGFRFLQPTGYLEIKSGQVLLHLLSNTRSIAFRSRWRNSAWLKSGFWQFIAQRAAGGEGTSHNSFALETSGSKASLLTSLVCPPLNEHHVLTLQSRNHPKRSVETAWGLDSSAVCAHQRRLVGPAKSYALLYRSLECDKKQHGLVSMIKHWIMKHRDRIFHLNIPLRIRNEWKRRTGGVQRTDGKCTNCWGTCCWQFREVYEARRPTFRQRWWCEKCVTQIYQCVLIHHARFEVSRTEDECS